MMERVFKHIMPISQACVKSALRTLAAARAMGTIESPAQTLVRKHFAVLLSDPPPPDFALIERTFRAIDRQFSLATVIPEQIFIKFPFTLSYAEMAESRALAMSLMHGVAEHGQTVTIDARDGSTSAKLPADAVVLLPVYFFADYDLQIGTLIHELGHFVGQPEGDPDGIDDPPGNSSSDDALALLPPQQRPRIAECYSQFAFEAHFGRSMFRALIKF
jgi:hypothetical protein